VVARAAIPAEVSTGARSHRTARPALTPEEE
jgi:hypothetical protein